MPESRCSESSPLHETPVPVLRELTAAERLVAVHLIEGLSTKEIAALLGKAIPTIKHQTGSILRRTGACSRVRFTALYYQQCLAQRVSTLAAGE